MRYLENVRNICACARRLDAGTYMRTWPRGGGIKSDPAAERHEAYVQGEQVGLCVSVDVPS